MNNKQIWNYGFIGIGIVLIFFSGFYFNTVQGEYDVVCGDCVTQICQNKDVVCGDFGFYYWKFGVLFAIGGVGIMLIFGREFNG